MKDVLKTIIDTLVNNPEDVIIEEKVVDEKHVSYIVKLSKSDMGRVIGKQGKIATAIRTVMKSIAGQENKKVSIEIEQR